MLIASVFDPNITTGKMIAETKTLIADIDNLIRQHKWFDFYVLNYDGFKLSIAGSIDLAYYHTLEIIFEDIFFVSGFFNGWHSDTNSVVFLSPDNEKELNKRFEIEQGYQLFIFKTEDYQNDIVIAAKKVSYNTDTVFYYDKSDLKSNEKIADFSKREKD